jgi:raffinose/stachyose/melibiose transport system permease protein
MSPPAMLRHPAAALRKDRIIRVGLLAAMMLFAVVPLLSMFSAALAPRAARRPG